MSKITSLMQQEVTLGEVSETREDAFSDNNHVLDICRKRKRSDEEQEQELLEEDNDGFKTPTRPENRIPEVRECPPAPRKGETEYLAMRRGHVVTRRELAPRPNSRKGKTSKRTLFIRSLIREVAGFAPYEKRITELLKVGKDKRALKVAKRKLGTHKRAKRKREEMSSVLRKMRSGGGGVTEKKK
ncbi:hypothetical protein YC2023_064463 [Brassica napus]